MESLSLAAASRAFSSIGSSSGKDARRVAAMAPWASQVIRRVMSGLVFER
jgi:hypothetical protein